MMKRNIRLFLLTLSVMLALAGGLVASRSQAAGSPAVTYTYDSLGRLAGDAYSNYTGANVVGYTYDNSGNRTQDNIQ